MISPPKAPSAGQFMPEVTFLTNSWHARDLERTIGKRRDLFDVRTVFVGDSFLEGGFTRTPLTMRIEGMLLDKNIRNIEAVNLGISATDLAEYYYRTREVALKIEPDLIVLSFYSGNDFTDKPFDSREWRLVAPLPYPSIAGTTMPHATWIARNIMRPVDTGKDQKLVDRILELPPDQRLEQLVEHVRRYYAPTSSVGAIREILLRGGDRFWTEVAPRRFDREILAGWAIKRLVTWELDEQAALRGDAMGPDDQVVDATLSWLDATYRMVTTDKVRFVVVLAPVGIVDPQYADFWRPWPKFLKYNETADTRHHLLAGRLRQKDIPFIDLRPVLEGIGGTYRKLDGHWNERGHEIVAHFLTDGIVRLSRDLVKSDPRTD